MNFAFLALACFPKKTKSKAELHTSSNPTLANSTREWGTLYMEVAYKRPKRERPGHPPFAPPEDFAQTVGDSVGAAVAIQDLWLQMTSAARKIGVNTLK